MTKSSENGGFDHCVRAAFAGLSLKGVSVAYYKPDCTLLDLQSAGKSWEEIPRSYFDLMGSDSIWLAEGRKFQFVLPSAMMYTISETNSAYELSDLCETLVGRLLNIAMAQGDSSDFQTRRILTIFQSKAIFLYLRAIAKVDHSVADEAAMAISVFWGRFEDC